MNRPAIGDATLRRQPLGWLRPKAGSAGARSAIAKLIRKSFSYFHNHQARLYWRFDIWFSCKLRKLRRTLVYRPAAIKSRRGR